MEKNNGELKVTHLKENENGIIELTIADDEKVISGNLVKNQSKKIDKLFKVIRTHKTGSIVVASLLSAIVISSGVYGVNKVNDYKEHRKYQKLEDEVENNLMVYINNMDLKLLKAFYDEVLDGMALMIREQPLNEQLSSANERLVEKMYQALNEKNNYATLLKEGCYDAIKYYGVEYFIKYVNAKVLNNDIYFRFDDVLSDFTLEEVYGDVTITYFPNDLTPYVNFRDYKMFLSKINKKQNVPLNINNNKEEENLIDNANLIVLRTYYDEIYNRVESLTMQETNNEELKAEFEQLKDKLKVIEEDPNYAANLKEGCLFAYNLGYQEDFLKYLNAKIENGKIYFRYDDVLSSYTLEDIASLIKVTYFSNDLTPYVSASELEEFKKSQEIEKYMKSL